MSAIEGKYYLPKIGEGQSHCLVTYVPRKDQCHKNRLLSILRRTRSSFLENENYLPLSKTAMDLCNLQFLLRHFWFKNHNELWKNIQFWEYFWADLSAQAGISPLLEQRVPPLEVLYHIILACKLFEPARGSSKLSSRANLQPFSEGRTNLYFIIPLPVGC